VTGKSFSKIAFWQKRTIDRSGVKDAAACADAAGKFKAALGATKSA
jgi:hypothetical protein